MKPDDDIDRLSPSDRLPLLILAKVFDHKAQKELNQTYARQDRKVAQEARELAIRLKAK